MPSPMDRMMSEVNAESPQHTPGSVPPLARRIIPVGYVPDEGEVLPAPVAAPVAAPPAPPAPPAPVVAPPAPPAPEPVVEAPAPIVVAGTPVTVVEEWQATDAEGNPVGPPSKIFGKGATEVEAYKDLAHKLREANIQAARKIKEYRDKYRTYDREKVAMTFDPQPLTAEKRIEIARLLADPATVEDGYALLYQAQFGESPEQVRARRAREQEAEWLALGKQETDKFLVEHPDFPVGPISKKLLLDEVQARKNKATEEGSSFGWTAHNLEIVYDDLVERGLLTPRQLEVTEPTPPVQIDEQRRASQEQIPPTVASPANPPATAANTSEASGTRPRGTKFSTMSTEHGQAPPTEVRQTDAEAFRKEVNDMSIDELKRRIKSDRVFKARLDSMK